MTTAYPIPGVYVNEIDLSQRPQQPIGENAAIAMYSVRGPIGPTYYTAPADFISDFGAGDPKQGFGHYSVLACLDETGVYVRRVTNNALYGGLTVMSDREDRASHTSFFQFPFGSSSSFAAGEAGREVQTLVFSDELVAGNVITLDIVLAGQDDLGTPVTGEIGVTTIFNTDNDTTMAALALDIRNAIDAFIVGSSTQVLSGGPNPNDDRLIRIISPAKTRVAIINYTITGGATQADMALEQTRIFDVVAENPGDWNNKLAIRITDIDRGTPQRKRITFSKALKAGDVFTCKVNGIASPPVTFALNSDTTMAVIASTIKTLLGPRAKGEVIEVGGGSANDRTIQFVANDADADFTITEATVAVATGTPPIISQQTTITRIPPDNSFTFEVYDGALSLTVPVETYRVSLANQQNGLGVQQNIADVINISANRSKYVRIFQEESSKGMRLVPRDEDANGTITSYNSEMPVPVALSGGDNGVLPTNSDIINGFRVFDNKQRYADIRALVNAGYSSVSVQKALTDICIRMQDKIAILDMPSDQQRPTDARAYRRDLLNINSSYAAIYTPDLFILDTNSDNKLFVPPSGYIAAVYARTSRTAAAWFAPAGLNRGDLSTKLIGLRHNYTDAEYAIMFPNQINAILNFPGLGYPIWGAETLQSKASALSNVSVRKLLILIRLTCNNSIIYQTFDPNDQFTRDLVKINLENLLQPIYRRRGLYREPVIICDETNNPPEIVDQQILRASVGIVPTLPAKFIAIDLVITRTGANITSVLESTFTGA